MERTVIAKCPNCGSDVPSSLNVDFHDITPLVRCKNLNPVGCALVYRITSNQLRDFIISKIKQYRSDAKVEVVTTYCEKKRRKPTDPHRSYASLKIAFSEAVCEKPGDHNWFESIGDTNDVRFEESIYKQIIQKYGFDRKAVEEWTKSYKTLEELEDRFGITENYIADIREYVTPRRITTTTGDKWIFFSAAAEKVIEDMLTDRSTGKLPGKIQIQDVYRINKDAVEFLVYVNLGEVELADDPRVRQMLVGETKVNKD